MTKNKDNDVTFNLEMIFAIFIISCFALILLFLIGYGAYHFEKYYCEKEGKPFSIMYGCKN